MDELTLLRQFVVDEPMADEAARAEVWRRLHEGQTLGRRWMTLRHSEEAIDRRQVARPLRRHSRRRRRGGRVAVAAAILVGGLLVTPAFGLGSRLLDLIYGKPTRADVQTPAWSPDGRKIAFVSRRDGNSEIYVMNADGSGLRNVTRTRSNDLDPAWSPDGRAIAFVQKIQKKCAPPPRATPCNNYETYLSVVNGDGSGLRRLTTRPSHLFNPSWSADGKTIRYGRYLVHADGTGQTELPRNLPLAGAWSPDGQRIAFAVARRSFRWKRTDPRLGLWVMNADGSNPRRVARNAGWIDPAWSPDGRRIAFRRFDRQFDGPLPSAGNSDLYVVNANGSGLRRLTRHAANVRWFAWSPDGRTIAFLREREVYIVKADGSGERRLTHLNE